ncbi:hypothetical protein [Pseudobdellovibrio sp. HCB154]|uniref:hypothetical protein n=1 Tax=Pseudobdellovibrio sp. HCB154 TaxID=3386277 RepID=UPI003917644E
MKRVLIIFGILIGLILILSFIGLTTFSYLMIDEMANNKTKSIVKEKNRPNVQATIKNNVVSQTLVVSSSLIVDEPQKTDEISEDEPPSIEQFLSINAFQEEIQNIEMPELCSIICEPSRFKNTIGKKEPIYDIINHYNEEGVRAMSDPKFRIAYHRASIVGKIFTPKILELVKEIEELDNDNKKSETEKIWLASRIVPTIILELRLIEKNFKNAEKEFKYFKKIEELEKSCEKRSAELVVNECQKLSVN